VDVEANWHGEFECFTGHVRGRGRKWLCTSHGVHRFLIKGRGARRAHEPAGHDLAVGNRSGGMKHLALVARLIETGDDIAAARVAGIAGGGDDDAERDSPVPLRVDPVERAVDSVLEEIDQVLRDYTLMGSARTA